MVRQAGMPVLQRALGGFSENRKLIKSASYLAGAENGADIENPHPNPLPGGEG
jgi:hypothetical protein